jgi:hypothetical protein
MVEARDARRLAALRALSARQAGAVHTVEARDARRLAALRALSAQQAGVMCIGKKASKGTNRIT